MLRIRSIHHDAFKSTKLARLSPEGERCWWRLQCLCDDDGRAEDDPEVIASFLFPKRRDIGEDEVNGWLEEMAQLGLIHRYEAAGQRFLVVAQWERFQHPRRPQTSKIPPPPASPVGTRPDSSRLVLQEGSRRRSGEEKEGESEGEPAARSNGHPLVDKAKSLPAKQLRAGLGAA